MSHKSSQRLSANSTTANETATPGTDLDALRVYLTQSPIHDTSKHAPLRSRALRLLALAGATALPEVIPPPNYIIVLRVPLAPSTIPRIRDAVKTGVCITTLEWLEHCVEEKRILPHDKYPPPDWQRIGGGGGESSSAGGINNGVRGASSGDMDGARTSSDGAMLSQPASQLGGSSAPRSMTFQGCRVCVGALWTRDVHAAQDLQRQLQTGRAKLLPHNSGGETTAGVPTHLLCAADVRDREEELLKDARCANRHVSAVTPFWVASCEAAEELLRVKECVLFSPVMYPMPLAGMKKRRVCVTLSGFQRRGEGEWNRRRDVLSRLAELLGARYNEKMRRRMTTHVVADDRVAVSFKVQRAREWGTTVVTHEWLLACAKSGKVVSEEAYPLVPIGGGDGNDVNKVDNDDACVKEHADEDEDDRSAAAAVGAAAAGRGKRGASSSGGLEGTPRRSPRLGRSSSCGSGQQRDGPSDKGDEREATATQDTAAISLFKRLTAGLDEHGESGDMDDELASGTAHDGEGDDDRFRGRRSRSVSRDAMPADREWSMDASQSQVIVHRDLTPPPTPRSKGRSLPLRAVKRARGS